MKKVVFFAALVLMAQVVLGQGATTVKPKADAAVVTVDNQNFDFGKIKQGVPATHRFMFTNTGKVPVVITNAQPSCGCTSPNWTKEPILPGGQGFVDATYNAAAAGAFTKSITVTANTETGTIVLIIKGEVVAEPVNN